MSHFFLAITNVEEFTWWLKNVDPKLNFDPAKTWEQMKGELGLDTISKKELEFFIQSPEWDKMKFPTAIKAKLIAWFGKTPSFKRTFF